MFYSHQLLARKAPLGQIWMAATMHAKINRRNLDKIDIVKICEEILNPSIPLALRLTGILMGGVVIVYERKVKLLYEDVTRLLVQINEAWRVTTVGDPTLLPKGKSQAKFEAITLKDGDEIEQALHFSNATFDHQSYYPMQLDRVEEFTTRDDDQPQLHQVDPSHITLQDDIESHQAETNIYDRFDRFDIEDGEENNLSFTPQDLFQTVNIPQTPKQTPPPQEPLQSNEIQHERQQEPHDESTIKAPPQEKVNLEQQRRPNKRRRPRATGFLFDNVHIIIEGNQYQSWLQDTSDIISRTRTKKLSMPLLSTKINKLMDLPTLGLISSMDNDLLELWKKSSMKQSNVDQPGQGSSSHLHENNYPPEHSFEFAAAENFQGDLGAQQHQSPVEKGLPNIDFLGTSDSLKRKLFGMTAGSSGGGQSANSISSSASGPISLELEPKLASGSTSKRKAYSSASHSSGGLDRVDEEIILGENKGNFKLPRVSEDGSTGELELLVETAPTQTPKPIVPPTLDRTTHSILNHLKEHFDMRGAPQTESLNQLTFGMNPSQAARLFYQTCVLASHDFVTVEQVESYGDISISRGAKM